MNTLQKSGGIAALYQAAAYLIGITIFLVVLDYPSITDINQKVSLMVEQQKMIYATNLLMYVFFGISLVILSLALDERLRSGAPALTKVATVIGLIWAGSLIASGMISNAGIAPVVTLQATNPQQAALTLTTIETVASNGIGNGNGEILGGVWTLLISLAGLRGGSLPKGLNYFGVLIGAAGIASVFPGLTDLVSLFGISQLIWFIGIGIILFRKN